MASGVVGSFCSKNDLACFIQDAIERPAISQIETYRELVPLENHVSIYPGTVLVFFTSAGLLFFVP